MNPSARRRHALRLEARRELILSSLDEDRRAEVENLDVGTLICMLNAGRFDMLPGMS